MELPVQVKEEWTDSEVKVKVEVDEATQVKAEVKAEILEANHTEKVKFEIKKEEESVTVQLGRTEEAPLEEAQVGSPSSQEVLLRRSRRTTRAKVNYAPEIEVESDSSDADSDWEGEASSPVQSEPQSDEEAAQVSEQREASVSRPKGEGPYSCAQCGHRFATASNRKTHTRKHTGEKPYQCAQCPLAFHRSDLRGIHVRALHMKEAPFKCSRCEKRFTTQVQATNHELTHLPIAQRRPYVCQVDGCGRKFTKKASIDGHMLIHQGIKPFKCAQCGKSFRGSGDLTVHIRRHSGERPYKCTLCPMAFASSTHLTRHSAVHRSSRARPFACSVTGCGKRFIVNSQLSRHKKRVHK